MNNYLRITNTAISNINAGVCESRMMVNTDVFCCLATETYDLEAISMLPAVENI